MNDLDPARIEDPPRTEPESSDLASCFQLLGRVEDQLRFADSKAGFLATLHAFLISPLIYNVGEIRKAFREWIDFARPADRDRRRLPVALHDRDGNDRDDRVAADPPPKAKARAPSTVYFGRIASEFGHDPRRFVALDRRHERTRLARRDRGLHRRRVHDRRGQALVRPAGRPSSRSPRFSSGSSPCWCCYFAGQTANA